MKNRFSPVHLLTVVLAIMLSVVVGESTFAEERGNKKGNQLSSLLEGHEKVAYSWSEKDSVRDQVFAKRAKKNTRVGKTFLRYANGSSQRGILLAPATTGNHQYIFTRHTELLLLYCVMQI